LQPQQFSAHFPLLVRAFLVGPLSPTDFSVGRPMDYQQTSSHSPLEMTGKHQRKSDGRPTD
jgi:hypothetical protein